MSFLIVTLIGFKVIDKHAQTSGLKCQVSVLASVFIFCMISCRCFVFKHLLNRCIVLSCKLCVYKIKAQKLHKRKRFRQKNKLAGFDCKRGFRINSHPRYDRLCSSYFSFFCKLCFKNVFQMLQIVLNGILKVKMAK